MAQFHFVEDYERHVANLMAKYPLDEAMSLAVGGQFKRVGEIELAVVRYGGLRDGMSLIDLGCGSGRLAWALGRAMRIDYLGIDVVQSLLDYAASRAPAEYRWVLHRQLSVPAPDASADLAVAFSVFTHLLQAETFLYLEDLRRVLRPGGTLMFSFLEFSEPTHWPVFEATVKAQRKSFVPHLNQFIARDQIAVWARSLGFAAPKFVDSTAAPWGTPGPLGQTIALLTR